MWTLTTDGFYSVMPNPRDDAHLDVCAFVLRDAERVRDWFARWQTELTDLANHLGEDGQRILDPDTGPLAVVSASAPGQPLPWTVTMPRSAWAGYLHDVAQDARDDGAGFRRRFLATHGPARTMLVDRAWDALAMQANGDPDGTGVLDAWARALGDGDTAQERTP